MEGCDIAKIYIYKYKREWERFGSVAGELTRGSKTPGAGGSPVACWMGAAGCCSLERMRGDTLEQGDSTCFVQGPLHKMTGGQGPGNKQPLKGKYGIYLIWNVFTVIYKMAMICHQRLGKHA